MPGTDGETESEGGEAVQTPSAAPRGSPLSPWHGRPSFSHGSELPVTAGIQEGLRQPPVQAVLGALLAVDMKGFPKPGSWPRTDSGGWTVELGQAHRVGVSWVLGEPGGSDPHRQLQSPRGISLTAASPSGVWGARVSVFLTHPQGTPVSQVHGVHGGGGSRPWVVFSGVFQVRSLTAPLSAPSPRVDHGSAARRAGPQGRGEGLTGVGSE